MAKKKGSSLRLTFLDAIKKKGSSLRLTFLDAIDIGKIWGRSQYLKFYDNTNA
jgi:hypothetical protein